jgi:hypothetical protein
MKKCVGIALFLLTVLGLSDCASSSESPDGFRMLQAVVVERGFESPGQGMDLQESGIWYLVLEALDGEASARFRFFVTQQQYFRFPEGASVELTLVDYTLRDIRPSR